MDRLDTYGGGASEPPLYRIWNVVELADDGQIRPPLLTDHDRWRRAIFDRSESMTLQRMNDSFVSYTSIDLSKTAASRLIKAATKLEGEVDV